MKTFAKWTIYGLLFLGSIVIFTILTTDFDNNRLPATIIATSIGSVLLGLTFYLTETKYIPWRKKSIQNKLSKVFNAKPLTDHVAEFNWGGLTFLVHIEFRLSMSKYGNAELVSFHIPRHLIDRLHIKPSFKYEEETCLNTKTYKVYQTNGFGITLAKKRFNEKLNQT
ncbi:MAG: hypothetical protein IPN36_16205 [Bacteroidetes bacterium]|nr:hypothetical protein [Bacteroidota bacterium]MBL0098158.1 hypothetical protein [Bacteroidota bacterium]